MKIKDDREIELDVGRGQMVYLCYRYRQVDPFIEIKTLSEAQKCKHEGINVDTIMVSEEDELLSYVEGLEMKLKDDREIKLDVAGGQTVYLCYRYRQVDPFIEIKTLSEAQKCKREGINVDTIMVSEEDELLSYVEGLERKLKGRAYYINPANIDKVLINDFISNKKKILSSKQTW